MSLSESTREKLLRYQKNEITEYHIYRKLAGKLESP